MQATELKDYLNQLTPEQIESTDITIQIGNELFPVLSVVLSVGRDDVDDNTIIIEAKYD